MRNLLSVTLLLLTTPSLVAEIRLPEASPEATVAQEIGISKVMLVYHRPAVKGRTIWGDLVPLGKVWRLGANDATTIELTHSGRINGHPIPAGKYALFAIPDRNEWTFIVNKRHKQWGAFFHKPEEDLLRFQAKPEAAAFREYFDMDLVPVSDRALRVDVQWEKLRVPFTIEFDVPAIVWKQIDESVATVNPQDWETFHQAARYAINTNQRLDDAARWIDRAMAAQENFWNYEWKAILLHRVGRTHEAYPLMEKAKELARGKAPPEYIEGLDRTVAGWRSGLLEIVQSGLERLISVNRGRKVADKLEDVLDKVDKAIEKVEMVPPDRQGSAGEIEGAAGDLEAALKDRLISGAQGLPLLQDLARASRLFAVEAIDAAIARGGNRGKIIAAQREVRRGDADVIRGRFKDACAKFKSALSQAEGA